MIGLINTVLATFTALCLVYFIAYITLKILAYKEQHPELHTNKCDNTEKPKSKSKYLNVEIISKDLYMEAENLIATHDIYALQMENISRQIREIDKVLDLYKSMKSGTIEQAVSRSNMISDKEAESLVSKSLKLQENKCKTEAKILKIMKQLDKIAEEEFRRQAKNGE